MATARKEIFREEEDGIETVKYEIKHFEVPNELISDIKSIFDDYEYAQDNGVYLSETETQSIIEVSEMLDALIDRREETEEKDDPMEDRLIAYFREYKGFTIWL